MSADALLLRSEPSSPAAQSLAAVLAHFGVEPCVADRVDLVSLPPRRRVRLLCAAEDFLQVLATLDADGARVPAWQRSVHSVFVCATGDTAALEAVARRISGDPSARLVPSPAAHAWQISTQQPALCGPMSGLRITVAHPHEGLRFDRPACAASIIGDGERHAFLRCEHLGVPIFLSAQGIVDIDAPLQQRAFDVREGLLEAVPVVCYVVWAFAGTCWRPAMTPACVVVDDPPLWPRYGHLHFGRLLQLMEDLDFCTSVAFIPWNWRRGTRATVDLFSRHPSRLSLSIHGCDHTGGEYGEVDPDAILWRTRQALARMTRHASRTGLPFDKVMVFPQGVFSEAGVDALKRTGFLAAANTEVASVDGRARPIRTRDYWDVAVMNYASFPIFTRRHPSDGIENFAFDMLLGKPCLVVLHHGDFHDDARQVAGFVQRLNALQGGLRWMTLGEVARHSTRHRRVAGNEVELEMYGPTARVDTAGQPGGRVRVFKRESRPSDIEAILVGSQRVSWTREAGRVSLASGTVASPGADVTVRYHQPPAAVRTQSVRSKAMVAARRYLCDTRDHYLRPKRTW